MLAPCVDLDHARLLVRAVDRCTREVNVLLRDGVRAHESELFELDALCALRVRLGTELDQLSALHTQDPCADRHDTDTLQAASACTAGLNALLRCGVRISVLCMYYPGHKRALL